MTVFLLHERKSSSTDIIKKDISFYSIKDKVAQQISFIYLIDTTYEITTYKNSLCLKSNAMHFYDENMFRSIVIIK